LVFKSCEKKTLRGISPGFPGLSPSQSQVGHVLLTRPPLGYREQALWSSFDLHVLSTPPAFVLSQDQTLREEKLEIALLNTVLLIGSSESTLKTPAFQER
jgi:hypothetical protein